MATGLLKVGELAERAGLTVRTLHWYDEIGLLEPSRRSAAGHRLYGADEVARLQQIVFLKQLGFALDEIRACLEREELSPAEIVEMHLARLDEEIEAKRRLRRRLGAVARKLRDDQEISIEEFLRTIEMATLFERHYTAEQLRRLEQRGEEIGAERIEESQRQWRELLEAFAAHRAEGSDPDDETVQELVRRADALIGEFTGGDRDIEASLRRMYREEPDLLARFGLEVDPAVVEFMAAARRVSSKKSGSPDR